MSEPSVLSSTSQFQAEPVEGRRVSKVVKTTMVHGERMEKSLGDSSLATDLPSAKDDFEEVQKPWLIFVFIFLSCFMFPLRLFHVHFMVALGSERESFVTASFMHRFMGGVRVPQQTSFPS